MKIATWNLNSITARRERLLAFLAREKPDIVCVQELKCETERVPVDEISHVGYHTAAFGQRTYNGVAILSKQPIEVLHMGFGDGDEDTAARFLLTKINAVFVASAYIPNGQAVGTDKYAYKLKWLKRLRAFLDKNAKAHDPLILAGDFNVAPEDRDIYDPEGWRNSVLFSAPEKAGLSSIVEFGFEDTFRKHHSEKGLYSWWDYRAGSFHKNHGARIDFVLATHSLVDKCKSARIDREERKGPSPSDHAPVIAEFN